MIKKHLLLHLFLLLYFLSIAQDFNYFNKIYNPMGSYARSRGVVENGGYYYCLTNTYDSSNTYQSFLLMKLNFVGDIVNQKLFYIPNTTLYPSWIGGTLKKTYDENLIFAYHADNSTMVYSSLVKYDTSLQILWKNDYTTEYLWTMTMNL